jgi:hypothetical protein
MWLNGETTYFTCPGLSNKEMAIRSNENAWMAKNHRIIDLRTRMMHPD